jgi:hypothetical protein
MACEHSFLIAGKLATDSVKLKSGQFGFLSVQELQADRSFSSLDSCFRSGFSTHLIELGPSRSLPVREGPFSLQTTFLQARTGSRPAASAASLGSMLS